MWNSKSDDLTFPVKQIIQVVPNITYSHKICADACKYYYVYLFVLLDCMLYQWCKQ